jgi:hypothetical protein
MRELREWMRRAALAALACAGAASSFASTNSAFAIDAEAQYLLDVNIRQLRLGDGVRGYPTPEGSCLMFGDMATVLDLPLTVDLKARTASGWAFREDNKIVIDQNAATVRYGIRQEKLDPAAIRETPEGWCVDSTALGRWLGISVKVAPFASVVTLDTPEKLPVELSRERAMRAKHLQPAALPLDGLPQVRLAYRMWRAPALDFIVSAGATYNADSGTRVDRRASIRAAGEIAQMSYDATVTSGAKGALGQVRFKAYRSEPDGGLLGPLDATHFAVGDVPGPTSRLIAGGAGRGAEVTNRPLFNPVAFDRTRFEGDLPTGWDAELYRNGQLVAFANGDGTQRYTFDDVQLNYGDNRFEIISYGPQGQQRSRVETINVGQSHVPPGATYYYAGVNQPGADLLGFAGERRTVDRDPLGDGIAMPKLQAAASIEHGLDKRTSVAALAAMMIVGDEKLTFVEGSIRRSVGPALVEAAVARQSGGGFALRGSAIARIGGASLAAEAVSLEKFFYQGRFEEKMREARATLSAPLAGGKVPLLGQGELRFTDRDGRQTTNAAARLSANLHRVNITSGLEWERQRTSDGKELAHFDLVTLASGRIGPVRVRSSGRWEISPQARLRSAEASAYWSASDNADWEVGVGYEALARRSHARLSHIRRFNALAAAVSVEAASDGSVAVGLNLNFSLDSSRGFRPVRDPLAGVGQVQARIFRDDNDNGVRDGSEAYEEGAMITAGTALALKASGKDGIASATGLAAYRPVAIGVDSSTLANPALTPRHALQMIVPRPGVTALIDIPLVGAGDIEGALVKDDGSGIEGLDVELVDSQGRTIATARTDFDGFFLFERTPYGVYGFRLTAASATAAWLSPVLHARAEVSDEKPVARIGVIRTTPAPKLAAR